MDIVEPPITDPDLPNSEPPPYDVIPTAIPVDTIHFLLPNSGQPPDQRCVPNHTFQYKNTSDNGQVGGARVGGAQKSPAGVGSRILSLGVWFERAYCWRRKGPNQDLYCIRFTGALLMYTAVAIIPATPLFHKRDNYYYYD